MADKWWKRSPWSHRFKTKGKVAPVSRVFLKKNLGGLPVAFPPSFSLPLSLSLSLSLSYLMWRTRRLGGLGGPLWPFSGHC